MKKICELCRKPGSLKCQLRGWNKKIWFMPSDTSEDGFECFVHGHSMTCYQTKTKTNKCRLCGVEIPKGAFVVRVWGAGMYCISCMEKIINLLKNLQKQAEEE